MEKRGGRTNLRLEIGPNQAQNYDANIGNSLPPPPPTSIIQTLFPPPAPPGVPERGGDRRRPSGHLRRRSGGCGGIIELSGVGIGDQEHAQCRDSRR